MDTSHAAGVLWVVLLLLGLGGGLGFLGAGYAQEGLPTAGGEATVLEEAKRLSAEVEKLYGEGQYAMALPIAQRVVTIREQALGPTHPDVATSLHKLARLYHAQGQYTQAEILYRRALAIRDHALGSTHPDVAASLHNLAELSRLQGQYAEAEPLYRRALAIQEQVLGQAHPDVAASLNNLALLFHTQGRYAEAAPLYQRAHTILEQALGPTHPQVATSLNNLASLSRVQGQYAEAASLYQRALAIQEQVLGPTHPDVATSLNNLAVLFHAQGQYAEAEPLLRRVLAIWEQSLGPTHPNVATSLTSLAELYRVQGQYAEAEPLLRRALTIRELTLAPTHPDVAVSLNNLALLFSTQGRYAQAAPFYQRSHTILEQALGPSHPQVAASLNNLAELSRAQGQYAEAEPLLRRALTIRELTLGPTHPDVATSLNNLAVLFHAQGQYAEAESLYQRALAIREQTLAPTHPDVAQSLNNLAVLHRVQGQYAEAEPLLRRALAIWEQSLGPTHPNVATSLTSLAELSHAQGQYAEAEPLLRRALAIREQALGPTHPDVAQSLNNLAELFHAQGQYAEAASLHRRALAMREQTLGPTHPDVAASLNNLAVLFHAQGQYAEAASLHRRALAMREQTLGPTHPDVAQSLNNLAELSRVHGQYAEAVSLHRRALAIWEQALGPTHPDIALSLTNLAALALTADDHARALPLLTRSSAIREHSLALMLSLGSEAQKLASAGLLRQETNLIVSLHTRFAPHDPQALRLALTTVLRRKGRVLEAMTDTLAALRRQVQPEAQELLTQWVTVRGHLATLVFTGLGTQSPEAYRTQLTQLDAQAQALEAQLSARNAAVRTQLQPVTLAQVQVAIPEGAALVELALYAPWTPPQQWGAERYVAYVLPPQGDPTWVELGEAAPIDRAVAQFRADLSGPHRLQVQASARALDELVLRPLRPLLGSARNLLIAPDGMLHLVPFGALVDATGRYLLESVTVSYLTTGRDLLRPPSVRPGSPQLVVGNPDFDRPGVASGGQVAAATLSPAARRAADMQPLRFPPLPSTAAEVMAVQRLLPGSRLWTGTAASEAALKEVQGPRLLHIATHGFFLADPPAPPPSMQALPLVSSETLALPPGVPLENPLVRAGLALAGANAPQPAQDDGLLTALEVAGLNLEGTELVVLSACDTGVGEVRTSEGVYGLRRALVMAGAASQVMSLWKVDDDATRELMVAYYRRLQAEEGRAEALRQVQLAMLTSAQYRHPFYWAAFVLAGAWTPLTLP